MDFPAPYPPDRWPHSRAAVEGLEFDWFAVDEDGQIGVFSSAGSGPVPAAVFQATLQVYNEFVAFLAARQPSPAISVFVGRGNYTDWRVYAERGIFAFDYQDVHRTLPLERHGYDLMYRPGDPLQLPDLPEHLRSWLPVAAVVFGETDLVPTIHLPVL